jgi:hypothetical protein
MMINCGCHNAHKFGAEHCKYAPLFDVQKKSALRQVMMQMSEIFDYNLFQAF